MRLTLTGLTGQDHEGDRAVRGTGTPSVGASRPSAPASSNSGARIAASETCEASAFLVALVAFTSPGTPAKASAGQCHSAVTCLFPLLIFCCIFLCCNCREGMLLAARQCFPQRQYTVLGVRVPATPSLESGQIPLLCLAGGSMPSKGELIAALPRRKTAHDTLP